jgi:hypothetical protein
MLCGVDWQKFTDVLDVLAASIIRAMMEADFCQITWRNIPEDSQLHIPRTRS